MKMGCANSQVAEFRAHVFL